MGSNYQIVGLPRDRYIVETTNGTVLGSKIMTRACNEDVVWHIVLMKTSSLLNSVS
jgi:hypothetical protein